MEELHCQCEMENENCCQNKHTPRSDQEKALLRNRINRIIGQLNGIAKMIDEDKYCKNVLLQISAAECAIKNLGMIVFEEHFRSCVADDIRSGKDGVFDETMDIIKKLR